MGWCSTELRLHLKRPYVAHRSLRPRHASLVEVHLAHRLGNRAGGDAVGKERLRFGGSGSSRYALRDTRTGVRSHQASIHYYGAHSIHATVLAHELFMSTQPKKALSQARFTQSKQADLHCSRSPT